MSQQVSAKDLLTVLCLRKLKHEKLAAITTFKTVVKRAFIDMKEVDGYFEALLEGSNDPDPEIKSNSFNTLCHLIRRVGMQDDNDLVLLEKSQIVLPVILLRLSLSKESNRRAACKILETYWLCTPRAVERALLKSLESISASNSTYSTSKGLALINGLSFLVVSLGSKFPLHQYFHGLINFLTKSLETYDLPISDLLQTYFQIDSSRSDIFIKLLETNMMPSYYKAKLISKCIPNYISEINKPRKSEFHQQSESHSINPANPRVMTQFSRLNSTGRVNSLKSQKDFQSLSYSKIDTLRKPRPDFTSGGHSRLHTVSSSMSNRSNSPDVSEVEHSISDDLKSFVPEQTYTVSMPSEPLDISLADDLYRIEGELASCFEGKETERNWQQREHAINKWRSLIRGNACSFVDDLIQIFGNEADGICKGILSLRTSLSNHSCYLVKELAIFLKDEFDSLYDAFIPTLLKQCATSKNITTTNANHTMCAIFMNCAFSHKFLTKVQAASFDKNVNPRTYSGLWLRIFLTRFHKHPGFLNPHGPNSLTGVDVTMKTITKLLKDPNPLVRTSGKECFWTFCKYFPNQADELLSTLDSNIVKAIGRSKDSTAPELPSINNHMNKGSQQSMREIIAAKRKETRSASPLYATTSTTKAVTRSLSIPSTTQQNRFETQKLVSAKLGPPRRISQASSSDTHQNPHQIAQTLHSEPVSSSNFPSSLEFNKPKVLEEHTKVNEILFEKEADPILKFLASSDEELINEGISLLKFAIKGNEDLSEELNNLLTVISVKNAKLLKPLFCDSNVILERCSQFFSSKDYLRICCLLLHPFESYHIEAISKAIEVSELFDGIKHLFIMLVSYIDMEDSDLVIQIISFKSVLAESLIELLTSLLERFPVTDEQFRGLSAILIKFQGFILDTDIYPSYSKLMVLLKTINQKILREELDQVSNTEKSKLEEILGNSTTIRDIPSLSEEITRVNVPTMIADLSPVKVTELTRILVPNSVKMYLKDSELEKPSNNSNVENMEIEHHTSIHSTESTHEIHAIANDRKTLIGEHLPFISEKEQDYNMDDIAQEISNSNYSMDKDQDEYIHIRSPENDNAENNCMSKSSNISLEQQHEEDDSDDELEDQPDLVEDFTKVHISPIKVNASESLLSPRKISPLDNFIERVDPLNKLASKNKPIPIFEDTESSSTLMKSKQHSFTDLRWYNLQMAKLTFNSFALDEIEKNDLSVERFKGLCEALTMKNISGKQILILLNYMQDASTLGDFNEYFRASGKSQLARSLFKFLESPRDLPLAKIQSGLIIIKLLLIHGHAIELERLWYVLLLVSTRTKSACCELTVALNEVFDEMLENNKYNELDLFSCLVGSIQNSEYGDFTTIFILESLSKVLDSNTFNKNVTESLIITIDQALRRYLSHRMVDIRRLAIVFYAKLIRLAIALKGNGDQSPLGIMNSILPQLTFTERKLVEYYSG
ncbi:suppressor of tub2 mutation [Scheffersomyces spartinae]|uniref:Protein STU1 n=1 Tax=Scheffersomyces spartinae TaxID=45513 RepID=A0A9P7VC47_9ASCO|nr:suppressor of tub2 mutation [Scheffersomyces spartinae]KAG7195323.1 suppressor of tub2 mutation [Scheffersomyces spartinae]